MHKALSKTFVLRRQGPGTKEVSKVQQGWMASRETEAVEIDLALAQLCQKATWLIGLNPAKGRQSSARLPCRENREC
jgi:hypothetical protein